MNQTLSDIINDIVEDHKENIGSDSRHYLEVSIAKKATELGISEAVAQVANAKAIVPLKYPAKGMKVRIDGRTFVNYVQFESGIAVPNYVARQTDLPHRAYVPQDSMILNFT